MAGPSPIEWCTKTWNPIVGCSIVSPGCTNCYAMAFTARLLDKPGSPYFGTTKRVNGHAILDRQSGVSEGREHRRAAPLAEA
jgi:protein gp37